MTERRVKDLDDLIDDPTAFGDLVTEAEWKILGADELNDESLAMKKHQKWLQKNEIRPVVEQKAPKKKKKKVKKEHIADGNDEYGIECFGEEGEDRANKEELDEQAKRDKKIA